MPFFTSYANKALEHFATGKTSTTKPTVYLALSTTLPTLAGGNITEPVGNGYARVTTSGSTWAAAANGSQQNSVEIAWSAATADWSSAANQNYVVAMDATTAGTPMWYSSIAVPKPVLNGQIIKLPIGSVVATMT